MMEPTTMQALGQDRLADLYPKPNAPRWAAPPAGPDV